MKKADKVKWSIKAVLIVGGGVVIGLSYLLPRDKWAGGAMGGNLEGQTNELGLIGLLLALTAIAWTVIDVWRGGRPQ